LAADGKGLNIPKWVLGAKEVYCMITWAKFDSKSLMGEKLLLIYQSLILNCFMMQQQECQYNEECLGS
jgi:hypothetical protein